MKKNIFLIFLFVIGFCNAQTTLFSDAIIPNVPGPLNIIGDDLYVGILSPEARIYKIDLSDPENAILVSDFSFITGDGAWKMDYYINNNSLYVRSFFNDFLLKIPLNQTLPITAEPIVNIPFFCEGIIINQNTGIAYFTGTNNIYRVDLNSVNPIFLNYYTDSDSNLNFSNPQIFNDALYFIQYNNGISIYKTPLNATNPEKILVSSISGFFGTVQATLLVQNYLYLGIENSPSYILRIDLNATIPTEPELLIPDYPGGPIGLAYNDGLFYGSDSFGYTIVNFYDPILNTSENSYQKN